MSVETSSPSTEQGNLRSNSIGLPGVLFQSITTMAPASAVAASLSPALAATGITLPLATLVALILCALIALSIGSLAKHLPSAGGYFTYVSRSLGPQAGWVTGWLYNLAYLLIVPFQLLVLGPTMDDFVNGLFHISLGWYTWAIVFTVVVFALTYFGVKLSADTGVVLGAIEIAIFTILSIWLIATGGSNNTFGAFNPSNSLMPGLGGWQGVLFGMIFVLLAFAGFESSAPLAEEARNPRRTVPLAILLAAVGIGAFYLLASYAAVVGWGPANIGTYGNDPAPWVTMAKRAWGPFEIVVVFAILNSALGNANAGVNAATRVIYAMGRTRTLPSIFAHVNRAQSPDIAIFLAIAVAFVFSLLPGFVYGPGTAFGLLGTIIILPIIIVYLATCVSVPVFYLREHRDEFNVLRHIIVPAIPFVALIFVLYLQLVPLPPAPFNLAAPIVAVWFVIGIIIVAVLNARAPQALALGSKIYVDSDDEGAVEVKV